jgi:hypothetical protein
MHALYQGLAIGRVNKAGGVPEKSVLARERERGEVARG